jgi:hypothetical protein
MAAWLLTLNCHVIMVVTTAEESNMIRAANFWRQYCGMYKAVTISWHHNVTCLVVHATNKMGSSSDDWIY